MKRTFTARVWREGVAYVAQCVEVDVASHGNSERDALNHLKDALELYFEPPTATIIPQLTDIEVEVGAT